MMAARASGKRRNQVVAPKVEIPEGWTPPVHAKTDEAKAFLKEVMGKNKLMKSLAPSDRDQLIDALQEQSSESGTEIITEGKPGETFYIIETGACDITIGGNLVPGGSVGPGAAFGELALLHNAPRAATVTATAACKLWVLDGISFKTILMGKSQSDAKDYIGFLNDVPILKSLSDVDRGELAGHLKESEFPVGKVIVAEGDPGASFYLIRSGKVKCTTAAGSAPLELGRGKFFGELALLNDQKRAATVTATETTQVLTLEKEQFTRLLGPLKDLISEETKEMYGN